MLDSIIASVDAKSENTVIGVAQESISREQEREYCVWVKPTDEGWEWLQQQAAIKRLDVLMPFPNGRNRARAELRENLTGELSTKFPGQDGAREVNSDIDPVQVLAFAVNPEHNVHLFERITIEADEEVKKQEGINWDIDVFRTAKARPTLNTVDDLVAVMSGSSDLPAGEWVKVELNVNRFVLTDIRPHIPFAFTDAIPSRTKDAELQAIVSHYWDVVTCL